MRIVSGALAALLVSAAAVRAEPPPCPQLRIIVPFSAGGATDVSARIIADPLGKAVNRTIVIENRAGATGNIGTAIVAKSPPDGCHYVMNTAAILTYQWVFSSLGYDPIKDLTPIGGIGRSPSLILTSATSSVTDLKGLVELSRKNPDGLTYATAGLGLMPHLAVEELARISGAKFVPVFFRGAPDFMSDLISDRITFGSTAAANSMPLVREGKLKALAVMQAERSPLAANIPTSAEQGMSRLDASSSFMLFTRAGTPKATVDLMARELKRIVGSADLLPKLNAVGFDPTPLDSEESAKRIQETAVGWEATIKSLNLQSKQ
jgi:tripartite-type tricarboxylate transporter receptor subunit TctC